MDMSQMRYGIVDTTADVTPNQGGTGTAAQRDRRAQARRVRNVGALAHQALLGLASTQLGVPVGEPDASSKGVVSGGGKTRHLRRSWSAASCSTSRCGAATNLAAGVLSRAGEAGHAQYKIVGEGPEPGRRGSTSRTRCSGKYTYVHNVRVPGMLHGRIVRPRGQGAYGRYNSNVPRSIDELDQRTSRALRSCSRTTSSASSRRRSTTRSRRRLS